MWDFKIKHSHLQSGKIYIAVFFIFKLERLSGLFFSFGSFNNPLSSKNIAQKAKDINYALFIEVTLY